MSKKLFTKIYFSSLKSSMHLFGLLFEIAKKSLRVSDNTRSYWLDCVADGLYVELAATTDE
ncbi:hypothetical protein BpHYR1_036905 [Brachionus plicatilis]|uniref:Uncharacterized protein n=1 Tax=Brachionus plicatilis TaxID=10195 RepID=A0A3M7PU01_BRAPC|nr:hypothetical protein BpHYR1_036905 [Brachionus plicatilis]